MFDGFVLLLIGMMMNDGWHLELWSAVVVSGLYHGLNPGMGWPLAVAAGLMERRQMALVRALGQLLSGHFLAMAVVLLPFGLLTVLQYWMHQIKLAAALLVLTVGVLLLLYRRHPRLLARIPPSDLGVWSFAIAIAHGAGLMLVPIFLGLCSTKATALMDHAPQISGAADSIALAVVVSIVHALAMISASGAIAWSVYRYLGVQFLSRAWFNLDAFWAASLMAVGLLSIKECVV